jgi:hypothetical protein
MIIYNARTPQAASTGFTVAAVTTALGTLIANATRSFLLLEVDFEGMGTSSGANELGIYRVGTAGVTGSNALTVTPVNPASPAFGGTGFFTYATQPIAGALVQNIGLNTNGQRFFWRCNPNLNNAISVPGGNNAAASISLFPISGGGTGIGRFQLAEI